MRETFVTNSQVYVRPFTMQTGPGVVIETMHENSLLTRPEVEGLIAYLQEWLGSLEGENDDG